MFAITYNNAIKKCYSQQQMNKIANKWISIVFVAFIGRKITCVCVCVREKCKTVLNMVDCWRGTWTILYIQNNNMNANKNKFYLASIKMRSVSYCIWNCGLTAHLTYNKMVNCIRTLNDGFQKKMSSIGVLLACSLLDANKIRIYTFIDSGMK